MTPTFGYLQLSLVGDRAGQVMRMFEELARYCGVRFRGECSPSWSHQLKCCGRC